MLNVPNAITLLRIALIPPLALQLAQREYGIALALFAVSALSDLVDGAIARHWNQRTRFGAIADPVADKLTMLTVTVLLAVDGRLPWWFATAVVARDLLIVGGAVAYHLWIGKVEMAPSALSKLNTALEFLLLAAILAFGASGADGGVALRLLMMVTLATIVLSGAHYAITWGRKAARGRR